jgi:hypothetical protein
MHPPRGTLPGAFWNPVGMSEMTTTEAKKAGMVKVSEWGVTSYDQGYIYAAPADVAAVRAAVDDADESNPDLAGVTAAGGVYIRD